MADKDFFKKIGSAMKRDNYREAKFRYKYEKKLFDLMKKSGIGNKTLQNLRVEGEELLKTDLGGRPGIDNPFYRDAMAIGYTLMREGEQLKNLDAALTGAKLYEKVGRGSKAIPRLVSAYEEYSKVSSIPNNLNREVESFIKRNQKKDKPSTLENSVSLSIASIATISGLLLSATNMTGNVIGSSAKINQDSVGLILLGVGLIALLVYKFRN